MDWLLLNGVVATALVYTLTFNLLDSGLRTNLAALLGLALIGRCLVSWPARGGSASSILFISLALVAMFVFAFMLDGRVHDGRVYAEATFRLLTGFAIILVFAFAPGVVDSRLLYAMCASIAIVAGYVALTGDPVLYAGLTRPAAFTGGVDGIHSAAFATTAATIGLVQLWRCQRIGPATLVLFGAPLIGLIAAFQVRTTWIMLACYAGMIGIQKLRQSTRPGRWIAGPVFLTLAIVAFLSSAGVVDYNEVSSGRSEVYQERLQIISGREPMALLFGTGVGSEMMMSSVWWWEAKNSHNDFIDLTIQLGLVGLGLFVALLVLAGQRLNGFQAPVYASFVISSIVSNGLIGRPFIALLFLSLLSLDGSRGVRQRA